MKKIFTSFALVLFALGCAGQDTIILKRPIWFYKKMDAIKSRVVIKEGTTVVYYPESDSKYYKALIDKKQGFVESFLISEAYQNNEIQISKKEDFAEKTTSALTQDFSVLDLRLKESGALISEGANQMILGTIISIGAAVAGSLLSTKYPTTGAIIVGAGGGLGLIFSIVGVSSIKRGGKTLQGYY